MLTPMNLKERFQRLAPMGRSQGATATGMAFALFTLVLALLASIGSAPAQQGNPPGSSPYPATEDSPLWIRASKIYGSLPGHGATVELLSAAPILSTATGAVQVAGCDCKTLGYTNGSFLLTNPAVRLTTVLPGWDGSSQVYADIKFSACSNEPNHNVSFSLRAGAVANGGNLSNPTFGGYQYITNTIPGAFALAQSSFDPLTVANASVGNNVVVFELGRLTDGFTNGVTVGSLTISYAKAVY